MPTQPIPYLSWTSKKNPVLGKLKLQSMERASLFYESWISLVLFDGGLEANGSSSRPSSITLNKHTSPKPVDVDAQTTLVHGLYQDQLGEDRQKDMSYVVKIYLWVETSEEAGGVVFDFQNNLKQENHG